MILLLIIVCTLIVNAQEFIRDPSFFVVARNISAKSLRIGMPLVGLYDFAALN